MKAARNNKIRGALSLFFALLIHAAVALVPGAPAPAGFYPEHQMRLVDYRGAERRTDAVSGKSFPAAVNAPGEEGDGNESGEEGEEGNEGEGGGNEGEGEEYISASLVSTAPRFNDDEIRRRLLYPPVARRAGVEGRVYLELFVDRSGLVRSAVILEETPPRRGFGRAAAAALEGLRGECARIDGNAQAVRFRYPVEFSLR
ncbi:MAG: energy transducer TonB [Treponema sp.]|jgi:TonB family protein|nr:energy transducer TonB [Treponema sp.]